MTNWHTIATFPQMIQAHLAKTKLESEGIDVWLNDELMGSYPGVIGVRLQVEEENLEKANRILTECGAI
jgi:hypothetical protein